MSPQFSIPAEGHGGATIHVSHRVQSGASPHSAASPNPWSLFRSIECMGDSLRLVRCSPYSRFQACPDIAYFYFHRAMRPYIAWKVEATK